MSEDKQLTGKITKLSDRGWGFIMSPEVPFTRYFFYWSGLLPSTLNFSSLAVHMKVRFTPIEYSDKDGNNKGMRAIKIEVLMEDGKPILDVKQ